ncbi:hypothetical protein CHUAL_006150 [Chamberlinius hualienensis]
MWKLRTRRRLFCRKTTLSLRSTSVVSLLAVCISFFLQSTHALELAQCKTALGMQSKEISDEDITASSYFDLASVGPQNARIRLELNGGAWCPKSLISKEQTEYLEIDLRMLKVITAVETQGRFGNGQGQEFAEGYYLHYWRPGFQDWKQFKNRTGGGLFQGNVNTYTEVKHDLNPPIITSKIRFIPFSHHPRTICMRVELYGCQWRDGLVAYSMPQGEKRGPEIDLYDMVYDGVEEERYLSGGLGQLTDGQKGHDNFRIDANGFGKGYEWVGWKNDTSHLRPVEITFEFDQVRNFSAAYFYANNLFTREVQVFSGAKIMFSVGGQFFNGEPLMFSYMPDQIMENARNVTVRLHNRIGRFVKFQMNFAAKWMMISEVSFESVVANGNFSEETEHIPPPPKSGTGYFPDGSNADDEGVSTAMSEDALSNQYIGLIIGVLTAVILLLVLIIFLIMARNRRRKQNNNHTVLKPMEKRVTINMKVPDNCELNVNISPSNSQALGVAMPFTTTTTTTSPNMSNSRLTNNLRTKMPASVHVSRTNLPPPPPIPSATHLLKPPPYNTKFNPIKSNVLVNLLANTSASAPEYESLLPITNKINNNNSNKKEAIYM